MKKEREREREVIEKTCLRRSMEIPIIGGQAKNEPATIQFNGFLKHVYSLP